MSILTVVYFRWWKCQPGRTARLSLLIVPAGSFSAAYCRSSRPPFGCWDCLPRRARLRRERKDLNWSVDSLHRLWRQFAQIGRSLQRVASVFAQKQRCAERLVQRLDARCHVYGVADHRKFHAFGRTNAADNGGPGIDADADLN